jgi:competence protein ComEA
LVQAAQGSAGQLQEERPMTRTLLAGAVALAIVALAGGTATAGQTGSAGQTTSSAKAAPLVNLNTATTADLEKLPGIGPAMAARIVEYRQKNGTFKKAEELMNIQGIGEKVFLKLKPLVTVTPPKTSGGVGAVQA